MKPELIKQLKDSGLPFKEVPDELLGGPFNDFGDGKLYFDPNLSELIKECGDKFFGLRQVKGKWDASAKGIQIQNYVTPEEAVAKLWLALHGA